MNWIIPIEFYPHITSKKVLSKVFCFNSNIYTCALYSDGFFWTKVFLYTMIVLAVSSYQPKPLYTYAQHLRKIILQKCNAIFESSYSFWQKCQTQLFFYNTRAAFLINESVDVESLALWWDLQSNSHPTKCFCMVQQQHPIRQPVPRLVSSTVTSNWFELTMLKLLDSGILCLASIWCYSCSVSIARHLPDRWTTRINCFGRLVWDLESRAERSSAALDLSPILERMVHPRFLHVQIVGSFTDDPHKA